MHILCFLSVTDAVEQQLPTLSVLLPVLFVAGKQETVICCPVVIGLRTRLPSLFNIPEKNCQGIKRELPSVKTCPVPRWVCTHTGLNPCWSPSHSPQINVHFKASQPDQDNLLLLDLENWFFILTAPAQGNYEVA